MLEITNADKFNRYDSEIYGILFNAKCSLSRGSNCHQRIFDLPTRLGVKDERSISSNRKLLARNHKPHETNTNIFFHLFAKQWRQWCHRSLITILYLFFTIYYFMSSYSSVEVFQINITYEIGHNETICKNKHTQHFANTCLKLLKEMHKEHGNSTLQIIQEQNCSYIVTECQLSVTNCSL